MDITSMLYAYNLFTHAGNGKVDKEVLKMTKDMTLYNTTL